LTVCGWRRGEALGLRESELDLTRRTATLGDTKTGLSMRPLAAEAVKLLRAALADRRAGALFLASRGDGPMTGFPKLWKRIAKRAGLPTSITPHVLRHSFASLASDLGYSEATIGALIGHVGRSTTSRYVHTADAVLLAAADAVARRTLELMGEAQSGVVVELGARRA
jgi:integrase